MMQRLFKLALAGIAAAGLAFAEPVRAADPVTPFEVGDGTKITYGSVTRRGVAAENGMLIVRSDGCYFSMVPVTNTRSHTVSVAVHYRVRGRHHRTLAHILAHTATLAPGETATLETANCLPSLIGAYPAVVAGQVARIIRVH